MLFHLAAWPPGCPTDRLAACLSALLAALLSGHESFDISMCLLYMYDI